MADKTAARALEDELHVRYGMQLSAAGELDQAMAQVRETSACVNVCTRVYV